MRSNKYQKVTDEEIIDMYVNHKMSLYTIYKKIHKAPTTIKEILQKYDIPIRDFAEQSGIANNERRFENRNYTLNYDFFNTLTKDSAYMLGFISADGGVYNGRLKIELKRSDGYLLEIFKDKLQYTGKVFNVKSKIKDKEYETSRLSISSIDMCSTLLQYGITENKGLTLNITNIPEEFELDFVRGYFDGDGFTKTGKYARFGICSGSIDLINWIANILHKHGLKMANVYKSKNKNLYNIEYAQSDSMKFYKLMYYEGCIHLIRKKEYFERYIKD